MSSTTAPTVAGQAPARRRVSPRALLVVGAALLAIAGGAAWIVAPKSRASTDDAYVKADSTTVAPQVRGLVAEVLVHDNQRVKAGDPLVRIDAEEFDAWPRPRPTCRRPMPPSTPPPPRSRAWAPRNAWPTPT